MAEMVLDTLRSLQQADLQLRRLQQKKSSHDRAAKVRGDQIKKQQDLIESIKGRQKKARMEVDKKELEVRQKRAEIEKLRHQQTQVKDNRQFQVLQNEIKFAELAITKFEDEILTELAEVEGIAGEVRQAEEELAKQQKDLEGVHKDIATRKEAVDAEIVAHRAKRDEIAALLPKKVVDQFNRVADRNDGEALAAVIRDEEEDDGVFVCGGCHMSVTQNTYVQLAGRNENLIICPNCTRILYLEHV